MRAAFYTTQGAAADVLQVGERPTPVPGPGEVRVRVRTSGVNPSDVKNRGGGPSWPMPFPLIIPHSDGAGEIDQVGSDVPASRIGERVWIWNGQYRRPSGTAADYITLPSVQTVPLPDNCGYDEGACLGIPALTAYRAIALAGVERGTSVLISGGAGAVGHYAVQMAKARGATVIATVSSAEKSNHARNAGAEETINYRTEKVADRVKSITNGRGVDAFIDLDLATNAAFLPDVVRPHGVAVIYGTSRNEVTFDVRRLTRASVSLHFFLVYDLTPADRKAAVEAVSTMMAKGELQHAIAARFPLERIADAHRLVESGQALGNVVVEVA